MSTRERRTFPLVPRRRLTGLPFGDLPGRRRGHGTDVIGSRPYEPALVLDRRPAMGLYPEPLPWLSKREAQRQAAISIAASASAARADIGSLDFGGGEPWWLQPGRRDRPWLVAERAGEAAFDAPEDSISRALEFLADRRTDVPGGTFLFVLSDFLAGPATHSWIDALGLGWDVVPVVIQDPVWERSWPDVGGVAVPVAEPRGRRTALVRLSGREAESLRREHEERYAAILAELQSVGLRPVEIESAEPFAVDEAFLAWAEERRRGRWAR